MWFSFMTGIGMNFKPLESKLIWSVVSFISERFLMCCLRVFLCLKFFGVFLLWFLIVHVWFFLLFSFPLLEAEKTYFSLCLFSTLVCFDIISENVLILAWISDANLCTSVLVITLLCLVANGALWFFFFLTECWRFLYHETYRSQLCFVWSLDDQFVFGEISLHKCPMAWKMNWYENLVQIKDIDLKEE